MKKKFNQKKQQADKPLKLQLNWRFVIIAAFFIVFLSFLIINLLPEEKFEFQFAQNLERLQTLPGTKAQVVGNLIKLNRINGMMYVVIPGINLDADKYDVCIIEMKLPVAYEAGHLLFTSPYNKNIDFNFRYDFDTGLPNRLNKQYIDLKRQAAWQLIAKDILVIPSTTAKEAELKSICFVHSNLGTKIKAWCSEFFQYSDPRLGSCFAMASPFFIYNGFSQVFFPLLGELLVFCLGILGLFYLIRIDERVKKYVVVMFFVFFLAVFGLLDARYNFYYLKGIIRDINLYWGKSLDDKRGIATGDPDFVKFMKYCDENIPLNARIFNVVSFLPRGTADHYLQSIQFRMQLRPRLNGIYQFTDDFPPAYYIVYQKDSNQIRGTDHMQPVVNGYIKLSKNETVQQKVLLWNRLEDLEIIKLKMKPDEKIGKNDLSVEILSADGKYVLSRGVFKQADSFTSAVGKKHLEPVYIMINHVKYEKPWVVLRITNKFDKDVEIGYSNRFNPYTHGSVQSRNDGLFYNAKQINGELAFTSEYLIKNPKLFKKFSEDAYIFTK